MTHIFDMQLHKVQVPVDMPEWRERYPIFLPNGERADPPPTDIVGGWRSGDRPLLPEEWPRALVADKPRKTWKDAFTGVGGIHVVSQRAKDLIESFDPDLHQFAPVTLQTKRGVPVDGPWYCMNVTVRQNSIIVEKSRVKANPNYPDTLCSFFPTSSTKDVVVDPTQLSPDIHFWREQRFKGSLLGSDPLVAAIKAAGLRFFPSYPASVLG